MDPRQRHLIQQVDILNKENAILRKELAITNRQIKEQNDTIKALKQCNQSVKNKGAGNTQNCTSCQTLQLKKDEMEQQLIDARKELALLQRETVVQSSGPFETLTPSQRTTIRKRLDKYFAQCLEKITDWATVLITIKFSEMNNNNFWQRRYTNDNTSVDEYSVPRMAQDIWWKRKVMELIHATDRYMVSNDAYNEIQMISEKGLPSTNHFKKVKSEMSSCMDIHQAPTRQKDSAYRKIQDVLMKIHLPASKKGKYFLKFSADGAVVGTNRGAVTGSIKIYDCDKQGRPMEFKSLPHLLDEIPIFHFFGDETADCMRQEAGPCFDEVMELSKSGIEIDQKHHQIELILCCDWKCFSTILALNSATSRYFCLVCHINRDERFQFTENDVGLWSVTRSEECRQSAVNEANKKGYSNNPLLHIAFDQIILDFLHLSKGVINKQLNQIVHWAIDEGKQEELIQEMERLKIPFRFYTEKSSDSKSSVLKWTCPQVHELRYIYENLEITNILDGKVDKSMKALCKLNAMEMRYHCQKNNISSKGNKSELLARLQDKLGTDAKVKSLKKVGDKIQEATKEDSGEGVIINVKAIQAMWREGARLLNHVRDGVQDVDNLERDLLKWGTTFMKLTFPEDITPYMHAFIFHTPAMLRRYGGLGKFQMEEVERLNKVNKAAFFRKTHQGQCIFNTSSQIIRYWNRMLLGRSREFARDEKIANFFHTKKRKRDAMEQDSSDEDEN